MNIILASQSPYRKELLERLNLSFTCSPAHIDEESIWKTISSPLEISIELARMKALKVLSTSPSSLVIGSDQVISLDGAIFGKPKTRENAIKQLLTLQKSPHQLITSVCIATESKTINFSNQTKLTIRKDLSREDISSYVSKDHPLDCAGSYKIEGMGIALFEKVETTDFTSIIGLPLMELSKHLKSFGIEVFS
jgi:septum formation protein